MTARTRTGTREAMMARASQHPTLKLCAALELLGSAKLSEPERLTRAVLIDVLCQRHPEADAAFQSWADGDDCDPRHADAAIVSAARAAIAARRNVSAGILKPGDLAAATKDGPLRTVRKTESYPSGGAVMVWWDGEFASPMDSFLLFCPKYGAWVPAGQR